MTDETISEKCELLYNKLNSFVTSVINRDVTPQINNLESSKADIAHTHFTHGVIESGVLPRIGTSVNARQSAVNRAIDEKLGSLSTSITNLIQVQEVIKNAPSVSAGGTSTQTFTVTACPSGYSWKYLSIMTGWGTVSNVSLSGTTLTVTVLNVSNGSHSIGFRGVLVYYPSTWNI